MTPAGAEAYGAILADPGRAALAFDYDGVLSPIVPDPDRAIADPTAMAALRRLSARIGTLAVITGRPADVVVRLGRFGDHSELRGLVVFGAYGRERTSPGSTEVTAPPPDPGVEAVRSSLPHLLAEHGLAGAVWVEEKGSAVAVHTRRAPDPDRALAELARPLAGLAAAHGLQVEPGRLVIELRPRGSDKGAAVRALVAERRPAVLLYAGDDLGDLAAFAAVDELRAGGLPGLKVCSGSGERPELADAADLVVDGPAGVAALLTALADELDS
jgi:trehalose 6-phosphate phosphatase